MNLRVVPNVWGTKAVPDGTSQDVSVLQKGDMGRTYSEQWPGPLWLWLTIPATPDVGEHLQLAMNHFVFHTLGLHWTITSNNITTSLELTAFKPTPTWMGSEFLILYANLLQLSRFRLAKSLIRIYYSKWGLLSTSAVSIYNLLKWGLVASPLINHAILHLLGPQIWLSVGNQFANKYNKLKNFIIFQGIEMLHMKNIMENISYLLPGTSLGIASHRSNLNAHIFRVHFIGKFLKPN